MRLRLVRTSAVAAAAAVAALAVSVTTVPASAGGGCHLPTTEGRGTTVELSKLCMSPTVLRTGEGATVTFVNRDEMKHNVSGNGFYVDLDNAGATWQYRFDQAGTYAYACTLHPGMTGAIVVGSGVGAGPVVEVGPYRPEPEAVATPATALASATDDTGSGAGSRGVPVPLAIALGVVIAAVSAIGARRIRVGQRVPTT